MEAEYVPHLLSPAPGLLVCFLPPSSCFPLLSCLPAAVPFIVVADMLAPVQSSAVRRRCCKRPLVCRTRGSKVGKVQQQSSKARCVCGPLLWRAELTPTR